MKVVPSFGSDWVSGSGEYADIVLSTRVRLARNLQGSCFGTRSADRDSESVKKRIQLAIEQHSLLRESLFLELNSINRLQQRILLERRLVSSELIGNEETGPRKGSAIMLGPQDFSSVMVNEEDHLRIQTIFSGLQLRKAWDFADELDDQLGSVLPFAYHNEFGFLTSCPTNVGSGLRASVLVHLPGLVLTKEIGRVLESLGQLGLIARGLYGEGSEIVGNFFQISNQTTLGKIEEDVVDHLEDVIRRIIGYEKEARQMVMRNSVNATEDRVWRAYGVLQYSRSLSFPELMNLLSKVRLGIGLKLFPDMGVFTLNKLMFFTQDAHLEEAAGRGLTSEERDLHRASYVRKNLNGAEISIK
jgi:protein arginine kinase